MMPMQQICPTCGGTFMGSDCLGRPCPSCDMGHMPEQPVQNQPMDDKAKLAEAYATIRFLAEQWMDYWHGEAGFGPPHRKVIKAALDAAPKPDPSPFVMVPRQEAADKVLVEAPATNDEGQ